MPIHFQHKAHFSVVTALGLSLFGLFVAKPSQAEDAPIPLHRLHIDDAEIECEACHQADSTVPSGMGLNKESCVDCHDELPVYKLPHKHRRLKAAFPHKLHSGLQCLDCHADMPDENYKNGAAVMSEQDCTTCHAKRKVKLAESSCRRCHGRDEKRVKPADHNGQWLRQHGRESRWRVYQKHGQQCTQCHTERACQACHLTQKPANHTGLWRARMHGSAASWNRQNCKTCHETGTCVACHRTASPPSHRGDFIKRHGHMVDGFDNNCQVCHRRSECIACHRQEQP